MGSLSIFIIRLILSVIFAVLLSRFFFPGASTPKVVGLAVILLGLAYLFEYAKRKQRKETNGRK